MTRGDERFSKGADLRRRAEAQAREVPPAAPEDAQAVAPADAQRMLHELRVQQIELQLQNEELRLAHAELDAARARYADLYDMAPVGLCSIDAQGLVMQANLRAAQLLGVSHGALTGQALGRFVLAEDQDAFRLLCRRLLESGRARDCELRMIRPDGVHIWAALSGTLAPDPGGAAALRLVLTDISGRKTADATLQSEVRRFQAVLSNLHGGILLVGNDGRVEYINQEVCDMFGLAESPVDLPGSSASELLVRISHAYADPPATLARVHALLAAGQAVLEEEIVLSGRRHFLRDFVPIDVDGNAQGRLWYYRDVTERQRSRESLSESEARFRMLAEDAPVMIWMTGPDHRYRFVNRAMLAFTGRTAEAQMAVRWDADAHPEDLARGREAIDGAARAQVPFSFEYRRRQHDGEYRWIHANGMPRHDRQGGFAGYIGTLSDITESKLAEQVLKDSAAQLELRVAERTAELETANKELEAFSYSVSHDLRAPVRHMAGFAVLAKEALPESEQAPRRHLEAIIRAAGRMAALIDDLLALSRTNRAELSIQPVALEALVREVAEECVRDTGGRPIALRIGSLPAVRGDPSLLRQVFVNLIGNAVKFTARRDEALIEVFAEPSGADEVGLCVRDNGAGFDMRYADRLFGVFERLHPRDEFEGTGIGLAIVKRIVQRHGGRVWVEAKPGAGAAFHLVLPRHRSAAAPAD